MAEVVLQIGGHGYTIVCRAGGEDHLRALARRVDAKVEEARASVGSASQMRQLLFAALLLADDVSEAEARSTADDGLEAAIAALAHRIEAVADGLEDAAASA